MKSPAVLLCPCHYLFDEATEGSEFSWAFHIGDQVARRLTGSMVVTGASHVRESKPYPIVELQPSMQRRHFFSLARAVQFNWQYSLATTRMARRHKFDIVHHVLPFAIGWTYNPWLLSHKNRSHKFVLGPVQAPLGVRDDDLIPMMNSHVGEPLRLVLRPLLSALSTQTIRRADAVIAIDERAKRLVLAAGAHPDHVRTIPPGIDTSQFRPVPFDSKPLYPVELLAAGHLLKRKAVDVIIRAVNELVTSRRDVHLTIVGDGPQRTFLQEMVVGMHLSDFVDFAGPVLNSELPSYYSRAHIFVNMSTAESFSVVCLEAMASGVPTVASNVGAFSDAIRPGENGYLIAPNDYLDLAHRLADLMDNRRKMADFGGRAREDAVSRFDWARVIIPRYLELYEELLSYSR